MGKGRLSSGTLTVTILSLLILSIITLVFYVQPAKAQSATIYIRATGSIDPSTAPISSTGDGTYALTGNIDVSIVIERDNTVIDGSGHTIQCTNNYFPNDPKGISLTGRTNVTIKNINIEGFYYGIWLNSSSYNSLSENNITDTDYGFWLYNSSSNIISKDNLPQNEGTAMTLANSSYNSINGNNIANIYQWGSAIELKNSSNNNSVDGNKITANRSGDNNLGIGIYHSSNNTASGNNIINQGYGIDLGLSSSNSIIGNSMSGNWEAIDLEVSNNNSLDGNNVTSNYYGFWFDSSSNNNVSENNVAQNGCAFYFWSSSNNSVYHNNLVGNTQQVYSNNSTNFLDIGPDWNWSVVGGVIGVVTVAVIICFAVFRRRKSKTALTPSPPLARKPEPLTSITQCFVICMSMCFNRLVWW
jgi:parallel beta-helix repeat protein